MPRTAAQDIGGAHVAAFLDMLAHAEIGRSLLAKSDDGYNVLVGGTLFDSYAHHPNKSVLLPKYKDKHGKPLRSTAAGRYQFLFWVWDDVASVLRLPDFGPASQDRAAVLLIRRAIAYDVIRRGEITRAINLCRNTWASLPGAPYGQPTKALNELLAVYEAALERYL